MARKPRIVIIGAGMAGLTAANKLYTCTKSTNVFDICVVEGGSRIGGRINTSQFCGDKIEMGATWIHGINGSPIHKIAEETKSLVSNQPWECMDVPTEEPKTFAEGGFEVTSSISHSVSTLFKTLMDIAQKKQIQTQISKELCSAFNEVAVNSNFSNGAVFGKISIGSYLKQGIQVYFEAMKNREELKGYGNWNLKLLEEAVFTMHENIQRTYTSAGDLFSLDYAAESEYCMFPGEEITIAKGYSSVIESLASVLPPAFIQLEKKVTKIEWKDQISQETANGFDFKPVKLHFSDGSILFADHIILTVSLGVLKSETIKKQSMFCPPLPHFKTKAIQRLGFGVVNKLFLQISSDNEDYKNNFPFLQMVFHPSNSEFRQEKIPWWIRKSATLSPIYNNSRVLLSWFAGEEALELESLSDEEIINGVSTTISNLMPKSSNSSEVKFTRVLKSKWGNDPLFMGSYSYVAVGSSGDDLDTMAEPLPRVSEDCGHSHSHPLQIMFAGEATHRTHYSTTHGAYFSGLREANRLLNYYNCVDF